MIRVFTPSIDQRQTALGLFLCATTGEEANQRADEFLSASSSEGISLDGLLMAESAGEPTGALLYQSQPDRTAFVWPPRVGDVPPSLSDRVAIEDALVQEACRQIDDSDAWIVQALLEPDESTARDILRRNGFQHLTEMLFMQRLMTEGIPESHVQLSAIEFDASANEQLFARLLEATYVETRDCPELDGTRSGEAALNGYKDVGQFDPGHWKAYRINDEAVGVLLFSSYPEQVMWELTYMGIVPDARGHGYGREMLIAGLHDAKEAGVASIRLAVDRRNTFARRLYDSLGFVETTRRTVLTHIPQRAP